jgi:hypothetical protein
MKLTIYIFTILVLLGIVYTDNAIPQQSPFVDSCGVVNGNVYAPRSLTECPPTVFYNQCGLIATADEPFSAPNPLCESNPPDVACQTDLIWHFGFREIDTLRNLTGLINNIPFNGPFRNTRFHESTMGPSKGSNPLVLIEDPATNLKGIHLNGTQFLVDNTFFDFLIGYGGASKGISVFTDSKVIHSIIHLRLNAETWNNEAFVFAMSYDATGSPHPSCTHCCSDGAVTLKIFNDELIFSYSHRNDAALGCFNITIPFSSSTYTDKYTTLGFLVRLGTGTNDRIELYVDGELKGTNPLPTSSAQGAIRATGDDRVRFSLGGVFGKALKGDLFSWSIWGNKTDEKQGLFTTMQQSLTIDQCTYDCLEVCNGTLLPDLCGICFGDNSTCSCFGLQISDPMVCGGQGTCNGSDICVCNNEYVLPECTTLSLICNGIITNDPSVCSGNGNCTMMDNCTCDEGYAGEDCQYFICNNVPSNDPSVCSGNGNCTTVDTCICDEGYTGIDCNVPLCNGLNATDSSVCSNHGMCVAPDTCNCTTGYMDDDCQDTFCNNIPSTDPIVCSGNGTCVSFDLCVCNTNFTGSNCEFPVCNNVPSNESNVCSGHGSCTGPNMCECSVFFTGDDCQFLSALANSLILIIVLLVVPCSVCICVALVLMDQGNNRAPISYRNEYKSLNMEDSSR